MPDVLERVDALLNHPDFSMTNPNKCRSVISSFAANMKYFHAKDGSGYKWLADRILQVTNDLQHLSRQQPPTPHRIPKVTNISRGSAEAPTDIVGFGLTVLCGTRIR